MAEIFILLIQILMAVCGVLSIICAIIALFPQAYNALKNYNRIPVEEQGRFLSILLAFPMVSVALMIAGWGIVFYNGIYAVLWFIPSDWGSMSESGWTSVRGSISGVFAALCVTITLLQIESRRKDNKNQVGITNEQ